MSNDWTAFFTGDWCFSSRCSYHRMVTKEGFTNSVEPLARMFRHLFKRPGLFEEVRRAGDEDQFLSASEQIVRRLVHLNHRFIVIPDDQQGRGSDRRQIGLSQVRSSTSSSVKRSRSSVASPSCCKWRDEIARAKPAAAASMCKDNDPVRLDWKSKDAL